MADIQSKSIADEVSALKNTKVQVISATNSFLTAFYQRTPTARVKVKVTITFPNGYPEHALIAGIEGVPPGLKRKIEKVLEKEAAQKKGTFHQVGAVMRKLTEFIDTNLFVPCWKELRQVVDFAKQNQLGDLRINELTGLIRLNLITSAGEKKYHYKCSIRIDSDYPTTSVLTNYGKACRLEMESTNLSPKIETMLTTQAQELVRRMQDGMSDDQALKMSNPIHLPPATNTSEETTKGLEQLTLTDAQRWQQEEKDRLASYGIPIIEYDGSRPQPSLFPLVTFLHNMIQQLPEEVCPMCNEKTLSADPTELSKLYLPVTKALPETEKKVRRIARQKRPVRVYCGHWYHFGCLEQIMTQPPFGANCTCSATTSDPPCGQRLYHPDWPADNIQELERAWAQRQAREREIADAAASFL
jgi:hypothetical protein